MYILGDCDDQINSKSKNKKTRLARSVKTGIEYKFELHFFPVKT